ncbi:hypothetical protein ACW5XW_07435 [Aeromonas piscicola]|uniref:hypothetical protein n=1 Tax=Aeromonas piscicola TaxID=600645 RepID=UPI0012E01622|nr:hypothetical protein [Aeromonas piscicola]
MLVDFSEKKLIEMTNILIVHRKVKNRYAEMVCPINRWRGEIGYWAEIGGAHYDLNERELLTRAELHLNFANELMNEEFNEIRVFLKEGGLIQNYTRAERVIMSLIFFLFYAKAILVMNNKLKNDGYRLQLDDCNVSRCVEVVLDDIGCITLEERDLLKKALPLE